MFIVDLLKSMSLKAKIIIPTLIIVLLYFHHQPYITLLTCGKLSMIIRIIPGRKLLKMGLKT